MKKIILGINLLLLVSLVSIAGLAQKPTSNNTQINGSGSGSARKSNNGVNLDAGTALDAQLQQTLDVKKAQVGDQVLLKVVRSVKQNGQTIIPKGANLVGRVTEVQQRTKNNAVSKLGVVFDRIQGQNLNMPVTATIVSVTNAAANIGAGDMLDSDISGTSSSSGRVSGQSSTANTSNSSGGGLLGGVTGTAGGVLGTTTNTVGNTVGGVASTTRDTVGNVAGATRQTVGGTTQTVGQTVRGLQISPSAGAAGSASGATTLSAADKNIRLEKGANFQLRVNGN